MSYYRLYSIIAFMSFTVSFFAQNDTDIDKVIKGSKDSLNTNPNYAYNSLSTIIKDYEVADTLKGNAYIVLSEYFNKLGVTDSAIFYANKGIEKVKLEKQKGLAYRVLGSSYVQNGKRDEALVWLLKSLQIAERFKITKLLFSVKLDLGHLYYQKAEYDKALLYFNECADSGYSEEFKIKALINIAAVYFRKGDLNKAKNYFKKVIEKQQKLKHTDIMAVASMYINIGAIDFELKNYDQAESSFRKSKEISEKTNSLTVFIKSTINLGAVYHAKEDYKKALRFYDEALQKAKEASNLEYQKRIYKYYEETYRKMEDYKKAHEILKKYHVVNDSITKSNLDDKIKELEVKYELSQVKYETSKKEEEIKNQKFFKKLLFIVAIIILIPIAFLMILYYQKHKAQVSINKYQKQVNEQKVQVLMKDQELSLIETSIKTQKKEQERIGMELHDTIGGNLAFVKLKLSYLDKKNEYVSLLKKLEETCDQIRDLSHDLIEEKMENNTFTSLIQNHINEASIISGKKIVFYPHPREALNSINETVRIELFKIIQELLSNAVKHSKASEINIYLNKYGESLKLIFDDNGVGFEIDKVTQGIGIRNIKNRIEVLSGEIHIDSRLDKGAVFIIDIPNTNVLDYEIEPNYC